MIRREEILELICVLVLSSALGCGGPADDYEVSSAQALASSQFSNWSQINVDGTLGVALTAPLNQAGSLDIAVVRGSDRRAVVSSVRPGVPSGDFTPIGQSTATFVSKLAIAWWPDTSVSRQFRETVIGLGSDFTLIQITSNPSFSGQTFSRISNETFFSAPALAVPRSNMLVVCAMKDDDQYYCASAAAQYPLVFSAFQLMPGGGLFNSSPALASDLTHTRMMAVGRGLDNVYWKNTSVTAGASWSGWSQLSIKTFRSAPAVVGRGTNVFDVFGVAAVDSSFSAVFEETVGDAAYQQIGNSSIFVYGPGAYAANNNRVDVMNLFNAVDGYPLAWSTFQ